MSSSHTVSRRALTLSTAGFLAMHPGFTFAQAPVATPSVDQIALYAGKRADLLAAGRDLVGALFAGEDDVFAAMLSASVSEALGDVTASQLLNGLETNRVELRLGDLGLWMNVRFDGSDTMDGFFYQGTALAVTLQTSEPQDMDAPSGVWTGTIGPGVVDLDIAVTFTGKGETLKATLDVPAQGLAGLPFSSAAFVPSMPIGDLIEEQALPFSDAFNIYRAEYRWGDALLVFGANRDPGDAFSEFSATATLPLPPDPAKGFESDIPYRLPADGQMIVFWGGDTAFVNYHATVPVQRHASDIVVWQDGSTYRGDGTAVEDYHMWGRPLLSPAAGTVVEVENGLPDIPPSLAATSESGELEAAGQASPVAEVPVHPAGNHVIMQTDDSEYVLLAHMQRGSVAVAVGDVLEPGDQIGLVGNSGNTSEPHIHIHLQNVADMFDPAAMGLPLVFDHYLADGVLVERGTPVQGQFIMQV